MLCLEWNWRLHFTAIYLKLFKKINIRYSKRCFTKLTPCFFPSEINHDKIKSGFYLFIYFFYQSCRFFYPLCLVHYNCTVMLALLWCDASYNFIWYPFSLVFWFYKSSSRFMYKEALWSKQIISIFIIKHLIYIIIII